MVLISALRIPEIDGGPTSAMIPGPERLRSRRDTMTDGLSAFHAANPGGCACRRSICATGFIARGI
jgi:hypothetical protein